MQQDGHPPQQVLPQQEAPQQSLQHVGHLSQHSLPQQDAAAGWADEAPVNPAKLETANMAVRNIDFMG